MDELLADFLTETRDAVAELDAGLLRLDGAPTDRAALAHVFRHMHTIKGTCGFLDLPLMQQLTHAAEGLLVRVRDNEVAVTPELVNLLLSVTGWVRACGEALQAGGAEPAADIGGLVSALDHFVESTDGPVDATAPEDGEAAGAVQTLRVDVRRLDDLMALASELVLTRNQLLQIARTTGQEIFDSPLRRLSHITSELQGSIMKARMQPVREAWSKLPRLVRELSRDLGKRIELVTAGGETELDRQVLDVIRDPLVHMVRNSSDHGLETPEQRRLAGKPETGRISLSAYHDGSHVVVEVADDGRGLSVDRIRAQALLKGLATEAELNGMAPGQITRFIFRPGFSTAETVTAISGRGVGMDVVESNIQKIGGAIELRTVPGHGTTFVVRVPLTLAVVSILIVEVAGERFGIPQTSVQEVVRLSDQIGAPDTCWIEWIADRPVLRVQERVLPLVSLEALLQLHRKDGRAAEERHAVIAAIGARKLGLLVDRVFDVEEIVIKPMAPFLRRAGLFSGTTILGDGSVVTILDPNGAAQACAIEAKDYRMVAPGAEPAAEPAEEPLAMLMFRAGGPEARALPLGMVARIEEIARDRIEYAGGKPITHYRGRLMPLVPVFGAGAQEGRQTVLVFTDGERNAGLMVDEVLDVVHEDADMELSSQVPGLLGSAVLAGQRTALIDPVHWLSQAWPDWFQDAPAETDSRDIRVLVLEDSSFLCHMLVPALSAAGYHVRRVDSVARAFQLRDAGLPFDVIICDVEMPDIDGYAFARQVRMGGGAAESGQADHWAELPIIALSSRVTPDVLVAIEAAGFSDCVGKNDADVLMESIRRCLSRADG